MSIDRIKRDSLSKQISDQLEQMIESGKFKIGEKIPTEPELMDLFQVSRNTIREAIRALTWSGILEVRQGDGTYVKASNGFCANMKKKYEQVSLEDIQEARNCIEVTIAHLAAIRREESDLKNISEKLKNRSELRENVKENTLADIAFHKSIAQASHNVIMIDLYDSISDYLENNIIEKNISSKISDEEIDYLHEELYRAIKDKNTSKAVIAAKNIVNNI